MSLNSHFTSVCLWCAQPVLLTVVAAVVWHRKIHKKFPVFFSYLLVQVFIFCVTFPLYGSEKMYPYYFWTFWTGEALNAVIGFKIIHEIFLDVFRPYHALRDLGTPVFKWAGAVMLLVSIVIAASNSFNEHPIMHAVMTMQRSVRVIQVGLVIFLIVFARFLGVSRKRVCFGIALGLGLFAGVDLILLAFRAGGILGYASVNMLDMTAFNVCALIWLGYGFAPLEVHEAPVNHLQTQRWEQGLADLQHGAPNDALIPMFETMVERAFSRNSTVESTNEEHRVKNSATMGRSNSAAAGAERGR